MPDPRPDGAVTKVVAALAVVVLGCAAAAAVDRSTTDHGIARGSLAAVAGPRPRGAAANVGAVGPGDRPARDRATTAARSGRRPAAAPGGRLATTPTRNASARSTVALDATASRTASAHLPAARPPLVEPDVLARAAHAITAADAREIRQRLGPATLVLADSATVTLAGHRLTAIAVDPGSFARFTPAVTARSRALWQRVVAGDVAVTFPVADEAGLPLGGITRVRGPSGRAPVRVGAFAAFGLPGVDAVTSPQTGRRLGLLPARVLLVSARGHDPPAVGRVLRAVLGRATTVAALHTAAPARVTPTRLPTRWSGTWRELYQRAAATCPGLPWQVLAAIGSIESGNGRDVGPSSAGALGPMQFLPSTWADYGIDADGDGRADILSPVDAVYSAARYLCDNGAGGGGRALAGAIYAYNHADWYVADVLALTSRID